MSRKDKPTIKEHYIPQFYLREFSKDGKQIYQYNIYNKGKSELVPIKSICYEKNLYELRNDNGGYIERNLIENIFSKYEGKFSELFQSIKTKSSLEENYFTLCLLSNTEKALLVLFLATQLLRTPEILNIAQETALEYFGEKISVNMAYNLGLNACLPIYDEIDLEDKNILNLTMRLFENMSFQIGITNDNNQLITSDRPVIIYGDYRSFKTDEVIIPLSSKILLRMQPLKETKQGYKNRLIILNPDYINYINGEIAMHSKNWIFSKNILTNKQLKWINEIKKG